MHPRQCIQAVPPYERAIAASMFESKPSRSSATSTDKTFGAIAAALNSMQDSGLDSPSAARRRDGVVPCHGHVFRAQTSQCSPRGRRTPPASEGKAPIGRPRATRNERLIGRIEWALRNDLEDSIAKNGYCVVCYNSVSNPATVSEYAKLAATALEALGGRVIVGGKPAKTYEAGLDQSVVIVELYRRLLHCK